jgi:glutaredoxin
MPVTIYTRATCAPCKAIKAWLNNKNIVFQEKAVDDNPENLAELDKITNGLVMTPITVVAGQVVAGMNIPRINSILFPTGRIVADVDPQDALNCEGCQ